MTPSFLARDAACRSFGAHAETPTVWVASLVGAPVEEQAVTGSSFTKVTEEPISRSIHRTSWPSIA